MPSERIEISYPGILDGKEYSVVKGLLRFVVPDPSYRVDVKLEENPPIVAQEIPVLSFVRRPFSNVFELEKK